MTSEHRLIVGLLDIKAVTLECKHKGCGVRLSLPPDGIKGTHLVCCPSCNRPWLSMEEGHEMVAVSHLVRFLSALPYSRESQKPQSDLIGVRVFFEFDMQPKL